MPAAEQLSNREARWLALGAQGLGAPRRAGRPPGPAQLRRLLEQVGTIQLDAVNVLARTQFLVPFSRLGAYDTGTLLSLTGPGRPWFEYWGHAASLLPTDLYPLFRWRMERERLTAWQDWGAQNSGYIEAVRQEVAERGPLSAGQLADPRRRTGEWWDRRSDGRLALEYLFTEGTLAAWRTASFERVYDVAERVIPPDALSAPTPSVEDAQRELLVRAARCLGVGTAADLADYFWVVPIGEARQRVAELVEDGRLVQVVVEGWKQPAFTTPEARPRRPRREHATLLSPFDSLIWRRPRTEQLFGFHYRIEIYVPAPRRHFGYYVLPLLLGDALVARFDLKADRNARMLRVAGAYIEPGVPPSQVVEAAAAELCALASWLGLDGPSVATRGNLSSPLRAALGTRARTAH
jgi:uncharacterized protein YcaQ